MTDNPGRQSGEHEAVALAGTVRDRDGRAIESIPQPGIARFPMTAFCRQCSQPVRASARFDWKHVHEDTDQEVIR
jgi:hypothetical protein